MVESEDEAMKAVHKKIRDQVDALRPKHFLPFELNDLTDEERRASLVAYVKQIKAQIETYPRGSKERKILGRQQAEINLEINRIRPKHKARGLENFFID